MNWTPDHVRGIREHLGLSQTDFAERLGFTRYQTVGELESGKRDVTNTVARLLDYIARDAGYEQETQDVGTLSERLRIISEQVASIAREVERR